MRGCVIVITGAPASGKTTISRYLAKELGIPCIAKDDVKEILFDNLVVEGDNRKQQYGKGSVEVLFYFAQKLLETGCAFILEGNFDNYYSKPYFDELRYDYEYPVIQIVCACGFDILYERFKSRVENGQRHPGHEDRTYSKEAFRAYLSGKTYEIDIQKSRRLVVDTSDFSKIDYAGIVDFIKKEGTGLAAR